MSILLRRLHRLAGRGLAAACSSSAAPAAAAAAGGSPGLASLSCLAASQQQAKLQLCWDLPSSGRLFSAVAGPEAPAATADDAAAADAAAAAPDTGAAAAEASAHASEPEPSAAGAEPAIDAAAADEPVPAEPAQGEAAGGTVVTPPNPCLVFVNNIEWSVDDEKLAEYMGQVGAVKSVRIMKRGRLPLGYGFVEFESPEGAAAAIERLNGVEMQGRVLGVRPDKGWERPAGSVTDRPQRRRDTRERRQPRGAQEGQDSVRVVVHGLPFELGWQELKDMAQGAVADAGGDPAAVSRAYIRMTQEGTSRGWGLLHVSNMEDAQRVIEGLTGMKAGGRRLLTAKLDEFSHGTRPERRDEEERF